ncbi:MAG: hypothetical protein ACOY4K_14450 [Pseudomonadota bacterium]
MAALSTRLRGALALAVITATTALTPSLASAEDRRVRIINETQHTIVRFYASNVGATSWEEDILGDGVLRPGQSVVINIDDGSGYCLYDFKAVFDDGDSLIRQRVDVCKISSYRYTED